MSHAAEVIVDFWIRRMRRRAMAKKTEFNVMVKRGKKRVIQSTFGSKRQASLQVKKLDPKLKATIKKGR